MATCLVAGSDLDEYPNLKQRGNTSFWHTLMGVTLPLARAMLESGACACAAGACRCGCTRLVAPPVSPRMLERQLALLDGANVSLAPPDTRVAVTLKRCDVMRPGSLPSMRVRASLRNDSATYLGACLKEKPWLGVRQLVGALHAIDFAAPHPAGGVGEEALFIPRDECACGEISLALARFHRKTCHPHKRVCLRSDSPKLVAVREGLHARGWTTRVLAFDGQVSVVEQARAIARASLVFSGHDSALANLVWARPGTAVLEFSPYRRRGNYDANADNSSQWVRKALRSGAIPVNYERSAFQRLSHALHGVRYVSMYLSKETNTTLRCDDWGCLDAHRLVELALAARNDAARLARDS